MAEPVYRTQQLAVLVVDDQDPMRKSLKRLAQSMGFGEVIECHDGESAIQLLSERPIDLIVTDLYMKKVSGLDLLEYVRGRDMGSDIPVIIVTGEGGQDDIVKAADKGAEDYLLKPFQSAELEKKISKALESYFTPSEFLKHLRLAERHFILGQLSIAKDLFEKSRIKDPSSARAVHGLALTYIKLGDDDKATSLLKNCIELNPSYFRAHGSMADIFLRKDRPKDAIKFMLRELQINPKQSKRQIQVAHLLLKQGEAKEAISHYRLALKEDPRRLNALMGMGHAMAQIGNLDKALYYFKRVRRYFPTSTKALEAGVRACMILNDWHKAELFLKDEKSVHPKQSDSYQLLATLYFKQKRNDAALELANEMLGKAVDQTQALQIKATALLNAEAFEEALSALEELSSGSPSSAIFSQIAELHLKQNRSDEAVKWAHKALAIEKHDPHPILIIADHLKRGRAWLQAILLYRKAASCGADTDTCQRQIAECLKHARTRRDRQLSGPIAS